MNDNEKYFHALEGRFFHGASVVQQKKGGFPRIHCYVYKNRFHNIIIIFSTVFESPLEDTCNNG